MVESENIKLHQLTDADISGQTVLYRSPYDIGVKEVSGVYEVKDTIRIEATLPTLRYLLERDCKVVVLTYVKRPDGKVVEKLRTTPHARALSELLHQPVAKLDDCVGREVREFIGKMQPREVVMLENTRFHPEEMVDDDGFARELARNGEVVVFDGFPQAHRIHASTTGILRHLPGYAGLYLETEVAALSGLLHEPERPYTVIIGGAKISDKVDAINNLVDIADIVLVGGGVANVFMKAEGKEIGDSFIEDTFVDKVKKKKKDWVEYAREIQEKVLGDKVPGALKVSERVNLHKIQHPYDVLISDGDLVKVVKVYRQTDVSPSGWRVLDVGPETQKMYEEIIGRSKTVFWNGPVGKFEDDRFALGSRTLVDVMAGVKGTTVIGGGDTIEVVRKYGELEDYTHVSLAGGATLEFLAGKKLPALEMLRK